MFYTVLNVISFVSVTLLLVLVIYKAIKLSFSLVKLKPSLDPVIEIRLTDIVSILASFLIVYAFFKVGFPY